MFTKDSASPVSVSCNSAERTRPSSPPSTKKINLVTQTAFKKRLNPVSFKNAFRSILPCQYDRCDNEEES